MTANEPGARHQCSTDGHYAKPNIYRCTRCTKFVHRLGDGWYTGIGTGSCDSRGYPQAIKQVVYMEPMEPI